MARILIIEDEKMLSRFVQLELEHEGYETDVANDGLSGLDKALRDEYDLMLLDLMLPGMSGIEICRRVRQHSKKPIIMLTAKDDVSDKVMGLDMGADDYVTKPLELRELVVRVKNLLWRIDLARQAQPHTQDNCYRFAGYCLNVSRHTLERDGEPIKLTRAEYEMLVAFVTNPGEILSRERLLRMLSARRVENPDLRTVDVLIRRLRHKLSADLLVTQHGEGYFLAADVC